MDILNHNPKAKPNFKIIHIICPIYPTRLRDIDLRAYRRESNHHLKVDSPEVDPRGQVVVAEAVKMVISAQVMMREIPAMTRLMIVHLAFVRCQLKGKEGRLNLRLHSSFFNSTSGFRDADEEAHDDNIECEYCYLNGPDEYENQFPPW